MRTVLEARQQRGLELAATVKIVRKRNEWIVPSQFGKGRYKVRAISKRKFRCNCPDHETNGGKCKHIFAVQYIQQLDLFDPDVAKSIRQAIKRTARKTYQQHWRAYNDAQTHEKDKFLELLHDLCTGVTEKSRTHTDPILVDNRNELALEIRGSGFCSRLVRLHYVALRAVVRS
jgi:uncharacterized Zn finger protein